MYVGGSGLGDVMLWRDLKDVLWIGRVYYEYLRREYVWMFVKLR